MASRAPELCFAVALVAVAALYGGHPRAVVASPYDVWVEAWAVWWMLATPPALLCELLTRVRRTADAETARTGRAVPIRSPRGRLSRPAAAPASRAPWPRATA